MVRTIPKQLERRASLYWYPAKKDKSQIGKQAKIRHGDNVALWLFSQIEIVCRYRDPQLQN